MFGLPLGRRLPQDSSMRFLLRPLEQFRGGGGRSYSAPVLTKIKFVVKHADEDILRRVRSGWLCMSDAWDELSAKLRPLKIKAA